MNARNFAAAADAEAEMLLAMQKKRAAKSGICVDQISDVEHGGDWRMADMLSAHGLPILHGKKERDLAASIRGNSRASVICPN
jgi:hypothetical protein